MDITSTEPRPDAADGCLPDDARMEKIREALTGYNAGRPQARTRALQQVALFVGGYLLLVGLLFFAVYDASFDDSRSRNRALGAIAGLGIFGIYYVWRFAWKPAADHQMALRYRLFPDIFGFVEDVRYAHGSEPAFLEDLRKTGLVSFTRSENDDTLSGRHESMPFHFTETKLVSGSGKNKTTVFAGIIFHFPLQTPFPGLLLAASKGGWLTQTWRDLFGSRHSILTAAYGRVDAIYEFHTDNVAAAQPVVDNAMAPALAYLRGAWQGGQVLIGIRNEECYLMMPSTKDHFMLPGIDRDIDFKRDILPMISELAVLLAFAHLVRKIG